MKISIRTLMIVSFLVVASFTLVLTLFINSAVTDTNQRANELISTSLDIMERSQRTNTLSDKVMNDLERISEYNL